MILVRHNTASSDARHRPCGQLRALLLTAGLAISCVPAHAEVAAAVNAADTAAAEQQKAPNLVPNFQMVSTGIWRGAVPSQEAMSALAGDGVKTIIDLRMNCAGVTKESAEAKQLGLRYYHFALGFNKPEQSKIQDILAIMTNPVNQPVFIHCRQGADRTGMLVGMYRRVWLGWSFEKTWTEMRQHHFKPFLFGMKREVRIVTASRIVHQPTGAPPTVTSTAVQQSSRADATGKDLLVSNPVGI